MQVFRLYLKITCEGISVQHHSVEQYKDITLRLLRLDVYCFYFLDPRLIVDTRQCYVQTLQGNRTYTFTNILITIFHMAIN